MKRLDTIWRLPGPRSFVSDVLRVAGRQHAVAVLPTYLRQYRDVTDALAAELVDASDDTRRIHPWTGNGNLTEALGFEVDDEDPPVTVPDILRSPAGVNRKFVVDSADLEPAHLEELPAFIRRVELESRSVAAADRCTFVWVVGSGELPLLSPGERSGVSVSMAWYWNRAARWDVAAHLMGEAGPMTNTVASEIKLETILQVCRWDFGVAELLMDEWDGDPTALAVLASEAEVRRDDVRMTKTAAPSRPPEALLGAWNCGAVESWHGAIEWSPMLEIEDPVVANRLVWSAQARVLLPWIEVRRDRLESRLRNLLGRLRFQAALREHSRERDHPSDVAEIGLLYTIAKVWIGQSDRLLTDAAKRLWLARNQLAHLRPMTPEAIDDLVRRCALL